MLLLRPVEPPNFKVLLTTWPLTTRNATTHHYARVYEPPHSTTKSPYTLASLHLTLASLHLKRQTKLPKLIDSAATTLPRSWRSYLSPSLLKLQFATLISSPQAFTTEKLPTPTWMCRHQRRYYLPRTSPNSVLWIQTSGGDRRRGESRCHPIDLDSFDYLH